MEKLCPCQSKSDPFQVFQCIYDIASSWNIGYQIGFVPRVDLFSEIADVGFDGIGEHIAFSRPDMLHEQGSREDDAGILHEIFQEAELLMGHVHGLATTSHQVLFGIER